MHIGRKEDKKKTQEIKQIDGYIGRNEERTERGWAKEIQHQ